MAVLVKAAHFALLAYAFTITGVSAQNKSWEKVKIATEGAYAPWNFIGPRGKLEGFEVELANELCARAKVKCEIVAQNWNGIIPALQAGKYDAIMAGMNITDKRLEVINFTQPYASTSHGWGVMKNSPLAKLAGTGTTVSFENNPESAKKAIEAWKPLLKGKMVGVQTSTVNVQFLEKYLKGTIKIREYKTTEQHDLDLAAGSLDAIFAGHGALAATKEKPELKDMVIAGTGMRGDVLGRGVAVGMRKADTELKAVLDNAITAAIADGTVKKLSEKWFKIDATPLTTADSNVIGQTSADMARCRDIADSNVRLKCYDTLAPAPVPSDRVSQPIPSASEQSSRSQPPEASGPRRTSSSEVTITDDYFGCYKWDDYEALTKMTVQQDQQAVMKMIQSGKCRFMAQGLKGFIQEQGFASLCLRLQGQTSCLWVPREAIQ